ncbi:MAG: class I SAM-dependent methyltransferase [Lachnospira sp.]|nr:class I SAM-dependent methyltransferase [Lachnospira sp.]
MNNKASITALMSSFGRAFHAENEKNPIFADTKAKELMTDEEYQSIGSYILGGIDFFAPEKKGTFASDEAALRYLVNTQIAPTPLARARFCEDSLKTAMHTGTEQYVILGAGMDTFAFREPDFMRKYKVFEVDHPLTQADKKERIKMAALEISDNLSYVPVDFSTDNLNEKLLVAGFDPSKKTFFSWLGVSYYLSLEQIEKMLDSVAGLSAEGSSLVFDYADENLFRSDIKRVQNMIAMAAAGGEPMKTCFSYEQLEKLLEKHQFLIYELLTTEDIQENYFKGREDGLTAFEHISYVNAVIK